jgi:hypothetical protein
MDAMSAPETVAARQGVFEMRKDLRSAQGAQWPGSGRLRDIDMLGKFWLPRHI